MLLSMEGIGLGNALTSEPWLVLVNQLQLFWFWLNIYDEENSSLTRLLTTFRKYKLTKQLAVTPESEKSALWSQGHAIELNGHLFTGGLANLTTALQKKVEASSS
jgi:hypothetical protein